MTEQENTVVDKGAAEIAASLFGTPEEPETTETTEEVSKPAKEEKPLDTKVVESKPSDITTEKPAEEILPPPKSWSKDKHALWSTLPKEAQEYYGLREKQMLDGLDQYKEFSGLGKEMRDVLTPYKPIITAAGLNEAQAVQRLLNSHYRLTQGSPEQRMQAFYELGVNLGFYQAGVKPGEEKQIDPNVQALYQEINQLKSGLNAQQHQQLETAKARISQDVQAFASDPAHQYFDEVADDIVAMIQAGAELKDAYEKAVWANPVTRQKEIARLQTENEKSLKENAKLEADKAKKAASSNVRTRDTTRPPTEVKGKLFSAEHEQEMLDIVRKSSAH